jgi:hypothetical protein
VEANRHATDHQELDPCAVELGEDSAYIELRHCVDDVPTQPLAT